MVTEWKKHCFSKFQLCYLYSKYAAFVFPVFKTDFLALHQEHNLRIITLEDLLRKLSAESKVLKVSFSN